MLWLFTKMAFQNVLRRPVRTCMLVLAVAICTSAVFSSLIVAMGIESSIARSFDRMGADLIVVPENAMVNITSALLTVQPTAETLDPALLAKIGSLDGVAKVAPQTIHEVSMMAGMPCHTVNLIAFDPATDFTVMPWLSEHAPRSIATGDLLCGYRREESVGNEVQLEGNPISLYGKLGRSGVGPFDESFFATYETISKLSPKLNQIRLSAVLVRLKFGASPEQVRFAISNFPGVKVIASAAIVTSTRQSITALMMGMIAFTALMLLGSFFLVALLFSAIIAERRKEIGLLLAIGSRRGEVVRMLISEAGIVTGIGGVCGILLGCVLLLAFRHTLVFYLETLQLQFIWPALNIMLTIGLACALLSVIVGMVGSVLPAWRESSEEPQALIKAGGL